MVSSDQLLGWRSGFRMAIKISIEVVWRSSFRMAIGLLNGDWDIVGVVWRS
jgi:hypothetical protein